MLRGASGDNGRIAVIDVGSNSLRLVVYDGLGRAPLALFNEKVLCGLGRGLASTKRLHRDGVPLALATLERFVTLARAIGVHRLDVIGTAAVRDAADGPDFAAEVEKRCRIKLRVIPGEEEGRLSALGVVAGIPQAHGLMGDLGGASVEIVPLDKGEPGASLTLPVGPLRLLELADNPKRLREHIDDQLGGAPQLKAGKGKSFYLVGGAWRALARIHMEHSSYPLHIIQHYTIPRWEAERFLEVMSGLSKKSLEKLTGVSKKRLDVVPLAAFLLGRLMRAIEPQRLVFSAFGLREGLLYDRLPAAEKRRDPLLAACEGMAQANRRFGIDGYELAAWVTPVLENGDEATRRLVAAAALLSDTGWRLHPDYRAEETFLTVLRMPVGGIDHRERAFVADIVYARYGGPADAPVKGMSQRLLNADDAATARIVGLALRLAYTMTGGAAHLLDYARLSMEQGSVTLSIAENHPELSGETVQRRLDALGKALGRKPQLTTMPQPPEPRHRSAARA